MLHSLISTLRCHTFPHLRLASIKWAPHDKTLRVWSMSKEGQQRCEGYGAQVLWGAAEGTGSVQSGEKEAQGRPYPTTLQNPN